MQSLSLRVVLIPCTLEIETLLCYHWISFYFHDLVKVTLWNLLFIFYFLGEFSDFNEEFNIFLLNSNSISIILVFGWWQMNKDSLI